MSSSSADSSSPEPYPKEWETSVVLSDGSTANVRPIRSGDAGLLDDFHRRQSQESVYFRFFRYRPELSDKELAYFTTIDYDKRMAFVALIGDRIVAVARYETWNSPNHPGQHVGEVAFFTDDEFHGKGLATLLLEYLAAAARRNGMDRFTATVLPANYNMLRVFRSAGFEVSTRFEDGAIEVDLGIDVTGEATQAIEDRDRKSQAQSVRRILHASSVAVIGAGRSPGSVGHEVARALLDGGFLGTVQLVNTNADQGDSIHGQPLLPSISVCDPFEVAVLAVQGEAVGAAVAQCAERGATSLVVLSSGFSESGPLGRERQDELLRLARHHGMRLVGPNTFGVINTDPEHRLHAFFVPVRTTPGSLGVLSQSGPLGAALLDQMYASDVGISTFATLGNRADVSVNDLLQYWAEDTATDAVALYVENFGNLRNFSAIAQDLAERKPVVAVAPADDELAELLAQSGLLLVDQVGELAKQCQLVIDQPLPTGNRVAIISNASSVARLAAAACRKAGLEPVIPHSMSQSTAAEAVLIGDLDAMRVAGEAAAETFEEVVITAAVGDDVDSLLLAFVPTLQVPPEAVGRILHQVNRSVDKPIVATGLLEPDRLLCPGLPVFTFPEEAARALGRLTDYQSWLSVQREVSPVGADDGQLANEADAIQASVAELVDGYPQRVLRLDSVEIPSLVEVMAIPVAFFAAVSTAEEALEAARTVGYPVVMKAGGLAKRSAGEQGGVALDLRDGGDLREAFVRMDARFGSQFRPVVVQQSVPAGSHLRVGLQQNAERGSRLFLGIGGSPAGSLPPQARIALPASKGRIREAISQPWIVDALPSKAARIRVGELLEQLAVIADASSEVAEVECNPVLVSEETLVVVDLKIVLSPWPDSPLDEVRHL